MQEQRRARNVSCWAEMKIKKKEKDSGNINRYWSPDYGAFIRFPSQICIIALQAAAETCGSDALDTMDSRYEFF